MIPIDFMKALFFFFLFSLSLLCGADPKICLSMIVKNEKDVICRCLESIQPLIDYWVIVDTGSTDGTQQIIKEFMKEIPGELHQSTWVNFSYNRNEALELAKKHGDYTLFIDADDVLTYTPEFKKQKLDKDVYSLKIQYRNLLYHRPQLIKNTKEWKWVGVVHEALVCLEPTTSGFLEGVTMLILGGGNRSQDPEKFKNDAKLLVDALKTDPNNTRYLFYLAQSYRDAQMPQEALQAYEKRVSMGGWNQEVCWSYYQMGLLQEGLNSSEEIVVNSYLKSFNCQKNRAEPLYQLSKYYRLKGNYFMAYLIAQFGLRLTPPSDALFLEPWIYDYGILLEYSISAYWIELYQEAYVACQQLLAKKLPQNVQECVERNLQFVLQKFNPEKSS